MRKIILGAVAALAVTPFISTPAQAVDTQPCVTHAEHREITVGTDRDAAFEIADTSGLLVARTHTFRARTLPTCWDEFDSVVLFFERPDVSQEFTVTGKVIS